MKGLIKMNAFNDNPLIKQMANTKLWTWSRPDKKPVASELFIKENRLSLYFYDKQKSVTHNLVTLPEMDQHPKLKNINRAYRLCAADNGIMVLDIEPKATQDTINMLLQLPIQYLERSMHNGYHALLRLPDDYLNDPAIVQMLNLTVIKFKEKEFEVLLNRHFVTFTKKICNIPKPNPSKEYLKSFVNLLVDSSKTSQKMHQKGNQIKAQLSQTNKLSDVAQKLTQIVDRDYINNHVASLSVSDFNDDDSVYEYNVIIRVAGHIIHELKSNPELKDYLIADGYTISDLIYATTSIAENIIPPRAKHDTQRDGLPYLVYVATSAINYIVNN